MRRIRSLAFCALVLAATPLCAGGPPTIEQMIERLADRTFAVREAAAKQIEALGTEALPALRKARQHPDAEVRRRVTAWVPKLERQALLAPKLVSLHLTGRPAREAVNAIAKQTGYKIELFQDAVREKQTFSFQFDRLPFWEALGRVCETSGALLQDSYGDEIIRLSFQDRYAPFVSRQGAFRLTATHLNYNRSLQLGSFPKGPAPGEQMFSESLYLNFNLCSEPRFRLLSVGQAVVSEAMDDKKHSMLLPRANNGMMHHAYYWGGYRTYTIGAQVSLAPPASGARLLKVLKGTIPVTLIAEQRPLVVTDKILAAKGKKVTLGPATFEIHEARETPAKQYEVQMTITPSGKQQPVDHNWINTLYGRIELQGDKNDKFMIFGSSVQMNGGSARVTFTYGHQNGAGGKPTKLIYNDWNTVPHEVPFSFQDVPLP
jgi:hypothetical protein